MTNASCCLSFLPAYFLSLPILFLWSVHSPSDLLHSLGPFVILFPFLSTKITYPFFLCSQNVVPTEPTDSASFPKDLYQYLFHFYRASGLGFSPVFSMILFFSPNGHGNCCFLCIPLSGMPLCMSEHLHCSLPSRAMVSVELFWKGDLGSRYFCEAWLPLQVRDSELVGTYVISRQVGNTKYR